MTKTTSTTKKLSKDLILRLDKEMNRERYRELFNKIDNYIDTMRDENKYYPIKSFNFSCLGLKYFNKSKYKYSINKMGVIRNDTKNEEVKPTINTQGYKTISMLDNSKKRRTIYVHHLVLHCFRPEPSDKYKLQRDHINQDRLDNRLCNLRWITKEENLKNRKKPDRSKKRKEKNFKKVISKGLLTLLEDFDNLTDRLNN